MNLEKLAEFYGTILSPGVEIGLLYDINNNRPLTRSPQETYILFSPTPDRDLLEELYNSKGLITLEGGLFSHIAIVSREIKVPYLKINSEEILRIIKNNPRILAKLNCERGLGKEGKLELFLEPK